ncbi:MAG: sigma-54-dependent Fis family transcriptional regulator [Hydrogenophilales bacterium CG17_big_fil_post_rev_8_21_14_2_50_63_12]|nr:MAG: sigma-54-dependent Fis family transcriptional regulator [Hydrogenophilales bacterium CG17_big_fil_post_rev_8_21_14_2_50_63_12]PIX96416.1 MAG: sigma-54-dependent Fis family transcriptional regulator [Hydrogenophilales bacterium CG_4_10_14_3_um_filter_63_21]PJB02855.1 MAG: sigma-54-dependent Fis family transcriptional regulator [Hydrogenophilales bacterium CG_4_9_14_3_um_filter_63_34]
MLIVDDDPLITDTLHFVLSQDFEVYVAESRQQVKSLLTQLPSPPPLALVDLGLPPTQHKPDEGFALITDLLNHSKKIKILVLSGQNDEANARHARALGAIDFIGKPAEPERIKSALLSALRFDQEEEEESVAALATEMGTIIGTSFAVDKLRNQIKLYAEAPFPVLIEGESGSGKELVAKSLHQWSKRHDKPYLALNCAAISPTLVEPTLFGYAKGAFTGAMQAHSGYFEDARDGTLFLDEIGELPLELQAKLLRVLENGEFQRVGETGSRYSNARIVTATNRDLRREVRESRFRGDLYHRLSVFSVHVPPLRDQSEDKMALLEHFRAHFAREVGAAPFNLSADALRLWEDYHFPGNVRELRNIVIRLTTKYAGRTVSASELEGEFDLDVVTSGGLPLPTDAHALQEYAKSHLRSLHNFNLDQIMKQWEQSYVEAALSMTHGNLSQAAKLLGVNRTTLYSRMQTYQSE